VVTVRHSRASELEVWMNGERVGRWAISRGEHRFDYHPAWLESPHRRPLSLSMPLRPGEPYRTGVVQPFFDNLLPDNDAIRQRIMNRFGTRTSSAFDLLGQVGRDCIGAVQLLPPGAAPPDVRVLRGHRLNKSQVAQTLANVRSPTMGARDPDDFRISLAGAQEKTAFLKQGKTWAIPEGTTPTTHIFKLPMSEREIDLSSSVENEWLCAQLLPRFGIRCASCEMKEFGGQRVLVVERFDRARSDDGKWIMRLPQEDLCQATATPPGQKYESEGGPGIKQILGLLLGSSQPLVDRADFFRTQFLFWLLCAIDGHAKNFSVFLEAGGSFHLTPRYDVLSAYPVLGPKQMQLSPHRIKMAMAVWGTNRHYRWNEIRMKHWLETGRDCRLPDSGRDILLDVVRRTPTAIKTVRESLPRHFPTKVSGPIFHGLQEAARQAGAQLGV
jgi:serine/threonine-protein kinase HipA